MQLFPVEVAIKASLIALGAGGILRALNVKPAAARHAVWAGVILFMLLLPFWGAWGPKLVLPLLSPLPEHESTRAISRADLSAAAWPGITHENSVPVEDSVPVSRHPNWNWATGLLGIYLIGAALLLTHLATGTLRARTLARRAVNCDHWMFSNACSAPITVGWLRPVVILPESWRQWPAAQLDAVLVHEHEHARRHDPLFQWLALLNRAVFWFHPLAWWLERHITALAEEACDDAVLARGHDAQAYSNYLIDMARSVACSGARIHVSGAAMPGGFLEQRVRRILDQGPLPPLSRARFVCTLAACVATSAALAASTLGQSGAAALEFEVVSIRSIPDGGPVRVVLPRGQKTIPPPPYRFAVSPGRLDATRVTLMDLIFRAYGVAPSHVKIPGTLNNHSYAFSATMPRETRADQIPAMLQHVLEERFHLKAHWETRTESVYLLMVAKGGPKLKPAEGAARPVSDIELLWKGKSGGFSMIPEGGRYHMKSRRENMQGLAGFLTWNLGRLVLDATGLQGEYEISLDADIAPRPPRPTSGPMAGPPPGPPPPPPIVPGPALASLGLRLESAKRPVKYLIVDSADAVPTEN